VFSECPSSLSPECWDPNSAYSLASPDAAVFLVREYKAYANFLEGWARAGLPQQHHEWLFGTDFESEARGAREKASAIADAVNKHLWVCLSEDCSEGFYGGYNVSTRTQIRARTWQASLPVWAGLADPGRAAAALASSAMVDLNSEFGLRSTSNLDRRYQNQNLIKPYSNWRGPVWINAGVLYAHALRASGLAAQASAQADALVHTLAQDLRDTNTWHESYHSDTGKGLAAPGFLSWDTLGANVQADILNGIDPFDIQ
jgi:Glycosyl hydrolase family 63 C-terminal domain